MTDKREGGNDEKPEKSKKKDKPPADPHREYLDMDTDEEEFGLQETPEPEEEALPEPERPVFTDDELHKLVEYVKDFTFLYALDETDWNEECYEVLREYFRDPTKIVLTIFYKMGILTALLDFPYDPVDGVTYFLRSPWQVYTADNFHSSIIFGSVNGSVENTILKVVENIYASMLFAYNERPKTIKDDVCSNMHSFLINLTDTTYKRMGLTVMYIPREGLDITKSKSAHENRFILIERSEDKELEEADNEKGELIGRLEMVAHFWIKQIREALANSISASVLNSIMDEFTHWNYKHDNLCGLYCQLKSKSVLRIIEKLENVQSESVRQFRRLSIDVEKAIEEATSNITYLNLLITPCNTLKDPEGIVEHVPKIIHLLRIIWSDSQFYNSTDQIETLCQTLSTQIIRQCREYVDLKVIFQGDADKGKQMLETCISSCESYKHIYDKLIDINSDITPNEKLFLKKHHIFNHVDAFVQRCRDVIEICDAMVVFGRSDRLRNFGGSKGMEHEKYCLQIENLFYENLEIVESVYDEILDVTNGRWIDHITEFKHRMTELEVMVENLVGVIFKDVRTIEERIEALYAFQRFKQRQCLQEILHVTLVEVWKFFNKELEDCKIGMIEESDAYHPSMPYYSGRATMLRIRKHRLTEQQRIMVNASDWLGDCDAQITILQTYKKLIAAIVNEEKILFESWEKIIGEETDLTTKLNDPVLRRDKTISGPIAGNMDKHLFETIKEANGWDALKYDVKPYVRKMSSKWLTLKLRYDGATEMCMSYKAIIKCLSGEERLLFKESLRNVHNVMSPGFQKATWNCEFTDKLYNECTPEVSNCRKLVNVYKQANSRIERLFHNMRAVRLVKDTDDATYRYEAFVSHLAKGREEGILEMMQHRDAIIELLFGIKELFDEHLDEITKYWSEYVEMIDQQLEKTLLFSIQRSLRSCLKFFHGEGEPLLEIQADHEANKITFHPEIRSIEAIVSNMTCSLIAAVRPLSRISIVLRDENEFMEFWETIVRNDVCLALQKQIDEEMKGLSKFINEYLESVECLKEISEIDNEVIAQKYADIVPNREMLEANMLRCTKLVASVQTLADKTRVRFVSMDLKRLKSKMIDRCETWREILCIELSKVIATEQTSERTTPTPSEDVSTYKCMATDDS